MVIYFSPVHGKVHIFVSENLTYFDSDLLHLKVKKLTSHLQITL